MQLSLLLLHHCLKLNNPLARHLSHQHINIFIAFGVGGAKLSNLGAESFGFSGGGPIAFQRMGKDTPDTKEARHAFLGHVVHALLQHLNLNLLKRRVGEKEGDGVLNVLEGQGPVKATFFFPLRTRSLDFGIILGSLLAGTGVFGGLRRWWQDLMGRWCMGLVVRRRASMASLGLVSSLCLLPSCSVLNPC